MTTNLEERLWAKVDKIYEEDFGEVHHWSEAPCWPWIGGVGSHGYGAIAPGFNYAPVSTHSIIYDAFYGKRPRYVEGTFTRLVIDHLCEVRRCVNPIHLELVTHSVNSSRGMTGRIRNGKVVNPDHVNA